VTNEQNRQDYYSSNAATNHHLDIHAFVLYTYIQEIILRNL